MAEDKYISRHTGQEIDDAVDEMRNKSFISNDLLGGTNKSSSAEMGLSLFKKSMMVIDDMEYDSANSDTPSYADVGENGLLLFDESIGKLFYFYRNGETLSQENSGIDCLDFYPDPHTLYCDAENARVMKWDGISFETISGGGMSMQISGTTLIFTQSQGGGEVDITPRVAMTPQSLNFGDIEGGESKQVTLIITGKHLTDDVTLSSDNNAIKFKFGNSSPSSTLILSPDQNGKLNGNSGYTIIVIFTASVVSANTPFSGIIAASSDGAESKTIEYGGRVVPEIVPMLYTDEEDETATRGSLNLYAPLSNTAAADLDSDVVGDYGVTKSVRVYTKNINGTITASLRDGENDSTEFSLDGSINSAEAPTRVTSKEFVVTEDGYIDIPVRLPKQAEAATIDNQIIVQYSYVDKHNNTRLIEALLDIAGEAASKIDPNTATSGTIVHTDTNTALRYSTYKSGSKVGICAHKAPELWSSVYAGRNIDIVIPNSITTKFGYKYTPNLLPSSGYGSDRQFAGSDIRSIDTGKVNGFTGTKCFYGCTLLKKVTLSGFSTQDTFQKSTFDGCSSVKFLKFAAPIYFSDSTMAQGLTNLEHVVFDANAIRMYSKYQLPYITITEADVVAYNNANSLAEGEVGSLISAAYASANGVTADEGKDYVGHRKEIDGVSVPILAVAHTRQGTSWNTYDIRQNFKHIVNDAQTFDYDVETDTYFNSSQNT